MSLMRPFYLRCLHRIPLILLPVFILGGCAKSTLLPTNTEFTPNHDEAVVIAGVWLERQNCPVTIFFYPKWVRFDPKTGEKLIWERSFGETMHCNMVYPETHIYPTLEKAVPLQWTMMKVRPGSYFLSGVFVNDLNYIKQTNFSKTDDNGILINPKNLIGFTAERGKIIYIGNFVFDVKSFPARLVRYYRDENGVKDLIAKYRNIKASLVSVQPKPLTALSQK